MITTEKMKKVLEEFTGTIGVGFLISLGLFFLTDSQFKYWSSIESLMETKTWGVLTSVPILIINYIFGLITIELCELFLPILFNRKEALKFNDNFIIVSKLNNELLTSQYNEVKQNKRILNGSFLGLILISIGVFLEGDLFLGDLKVIGIIGMIGSLILTIICPLISITIQKKFNKLLSDYQS
ncbi:hypothetical protein MY04_2512 [Flammeovirga sp. MY04]|uniref:hypothetical protein n=1 Tax=Flammeovirga sp. MY04 TaxID=1191459 RepID=UPI0008060803|nr:hypothetical protein [Flammeovirga sp. MY04]ANQ49881.1 hypothetical protein MY04_2512 [Flammeovirga sp. MY04]